MQFIFAKNVITGEQPLLSVPDAEQRFFIVIKKMFIAQGVIDSCTG